MGNISLHASYAVSGTDVAYHSEAPYGPTLLMCGTPIPYGDISPRACYAMPSTDLAYGAMRCQVLT
eukprot:3941009-Rhodomonas_salina.3